MGTQSLPERAQMQSIKLVPLYERFAAQQLGLVQAPSIQLLSATKASTSFSMQASTSQVLYPPASSNTGADTSSDGSGSGAQPVGQQLLQWLTGQDASAMTPVALVTQGSQQWWVTIELPLPVDRAFQQQQDLVCAADEGDWPGGMQQRFRAVRPLVDSLLQGYDTRFLGLLEDASDGVGLWSTPDLSAIGIITNPTFPSLLKLIEGGYGTRPQAPGHTIVAINPQWTSSNDIGQRWEGSLKRRAAAVMRMGTGTPGSAPDSTQQSQSSSDAGKGDGGMQALRDASSASGHSPWDALYVARCVRTARGACGYLHRAWPGPWRLYALPQEDASDIGPCVLTSATRPSTKAIAAALAETKAQMEERARELRGGSGWPW